MAEIILKQESYELVGICMEVHSELGMGFREIFYKDALEYEFKLKGTPYVRERPWFFLLLFPLLNAASHHFY